MIGWIAASPIALEENYRFSREYHRLKNRPGNNFRGTNDGVRWQARNGRWIDSLVGKKGDYGNAKWKWSSEFPIAPEADWYQRRLKTLMSSGQVDFAKQKVSFLDLHEDHIDKEDNDEEPKDKLPRKGMYYAGFGKSRVYQSLLRKTEKWTQVIRNRRVDNGNGEWGKVDRNGQVKMSDGTLGNLFALLGAAHSITMEFRDYTETEAMKRVIAIWGRGLVGLMNGKI